MSPGWKSAVCRRAICLCDVGSGECDQIGCWALCAAGLGRQTPLPAAGGWLRRRLLCTAGLRLGVHKVSTGYASAGSGDVSWGRWSTRPSSAGVGVAVGREGASGLFCLEKETSHRRRCRLRHFTYSMPCQNWASKIHSHSTRLSAECQSAKIKPLCYFYRWVFVLWLSCFYSVHLF